MKRMRLQRILLGSALLALLFLIGCGQEGPKLATVHGKVTLDGEPLPDARVSFQPKEKGRPASAMTDESGNYQLKYSRDRGGAMIGEHEIRITTSRTFDNEQGEVERTPEKVPAQYNTNTQLTKKVEAGDNEINFELQSQ